MGDESEADGNGDEDAPQTRTNRTSFIVYEKVIHGGGEESCDIAKTIPEPELGR